MKTIRTVSIEMKTGGGIALVLGLTAVHPFVAIGVGITLLAIAYIFEEELF